MSSSARSCLAIAVRDCDDRTVGIAQDLCSQMAGNGNVAVIGMARMPLVWRYSMLAGHSADDLERDMESSAAQSALRLLEQLPASIPTAHLVSRTWWHPELRRYLQQSGCHELVICGRHNRLHARWAAVALWRSGIKVRAGTVRGL